MNNGECKGILAWNLNDGTIHRFRSHITILATGGYGKIYYDHIQQAPKGCDFDFLNGSTPVKSHIETGNENSFRTS